MHRGDAVKAVHQRKQQRTQRSARENAAFIAEHLEQEAAEEKLFAKRSINYIHRRKRHQLRHTKYGDVQYRQQQQRQKHCEVAAAAELYRANTVCPRSAAALCA